MHPCYATCHTCIASLPFVAHPHLRHRLSHMHSPFATCRPCIYMSATWHTCKDLHILFKRMLGLAFWGWKKLL
ncbi:hypothetical protein HanIR_Chr13g0669621 [Helianthus annuus]|nr:hypothetical protein HanIR_Chr13g0669621 [Helianthus annuus]